MVGFPQAKRDGLKATEVGDQTLLHRSDGRELARLDRVTALVWHLADGQTSVDIIALSVASRCDIAPNRETVWAALDRLSDLDLMAERTTPPVGTDLVSRRGVIRKVVGVTAGSLGLAASAMGLAAVTATPAMASEFFAENLSLKKVNEKTSKHLR